MTLKIIGVYPIVASEPCHLVEVDLDGTPGFDWREVTQEIPDQPQTNWQVPYDEQQLDDQQCRWAFFFHCLDFTKPLLTPFGSVPIPPESPLPKYLDDIEYLPP